MSNEFSMMVPGATTDDGVLKVFAPYDGAEIGAVKAADSSAVEQALDNAYRLFGDRDRWLRPYQRIAILEKAARIMSEQARELAIDAAREGGKPLIDSQVEVARAIDGVKGCIEVLRTQSGSEIPMGLTAASVERIGCTRKEPIGVVVAVSAFNHPLNLIVHQIGPAVAAGCPAIVKPAEDTPLSCFRFVSILHEAGLPEEWCQALVVNDVSNATRLVTDKRVGFFSFIGSARVGWMLRSRLAAGTRCALEHGGAAPVIVASDADQDHALPLLAKGGFYHAGQVCVSVQRVFAHHSIARELAHRLAEVGKKLKIGDPTLPDTEVGPLIRSAEVDRVETWVNEAVNAGAGLLSGGKRISESCYECTVLFDPPANAKVSHMEIFGPVICVYPYTDIDQAITRANELPYAFQAAVFTHDIDIAMRAYDRLDASAIMVNDHTAFRVDWMPFAGLKESGLAVGGIPFTMRDMQIEKMLVIRSKQL
ncbi:MAG: aldehyde dehydrogenase family protein [Candidatus Krumholzibacteria bacterium]|nr:aldehyde dehydrogenase family protein [Candidatus Krumholzibacteria bacterium]